MKFINTLAALVLLMSLGVKAEREFGPSDQNFNQFSGTEERSINLGDAIFDELYNSGALGDIDDETADLAKQLTRNIMANPEILRDLQNGTLKLDDQFVAYAIGDSLKKATKSVTQTVKKVGSTVVEKTKETTTKIVEKTKDAGQKVKRTFKKTARKTIATTKDLAQAIASTANKVLTEITNNEMFMTVLSTSIAIFDKILPYAAPVIAGALTLAFGPPGAAVGAALVAAVPVITKIITPTTVTESLKLAASVAALADSVLSGQPKADQKQALMNTVKQAGSAVDALPEKSAVDKEVAKGLAGMKLPVKDKEEAPASPEQIGEAVKWVSAGASNLGKYLENNGNNLNAEEQNKIIIGIQRAKEITDRIDASKLQ